MMLIKLYIISYHYIPKKAFEEKLPKELFIRLFENQNEITVLGISTISVVEKMANEIRDKSDTEYNLYQSAEDVPDPRELNSQKKNLLVFGDLLLEKQNTRESYYMEQDTATLIVSI